MFYPVLMIITFKHREWILPSCFLIYHLPRTNWLSNCWLHKTNSKRRADFRSCETVFQCPLHINEVGLFVNIGRTLSFHHSIVLTISQQFFTQPISIDFWSYKWIFVSNRYPTNFQVVGRCLLNDSYFRQYAKTRQDEPRGRFCY